MREWILRKSYTNKIISKIVYTFFNFLYKKKYDKEVKKRALLSIFEYDKLTKKLPYKPNEYIIDNNLYGIGFWLKKYSGLMKSFKINGYVEHGLFIGSLVKKESIDCFANSIFTFGESRFNHLSKRTNKRINIIGPYIHYADSLLNEFETLKQKKDLGSVLLVFPSHSIKDLAVDYDSKEFVNEIKKIAKSYDSVLVCLYYIDALNEKITNFYEAHGFKITTAGHAYDYNFLSRLKSIIKLADYTISNSTGTHVGYCIYLNKPHYIFSQKTNYQGKNIKELKLRSVYETKTLKLEQEEIKTAFSLKNNGITNEQKEIVDKYWGLPYIMTPEALSIVLKK